MATAELCGRPILALHHGPGLAIGNADTRGEPETEARDTAAAVQRSAAETPEDAVTTGMPVGPD